MTSVRCGAANDGNASSLGVLAGRGLLLLRRTAGRVDACIETQTGAMMLLRVFSDLEDVTATALAQFNQTAFSVRLDQLGQCASQMHSGAG